MFIFFRKLCVRSNLLEYYGVRDLEVHVNYIHVVDNATRYYNFNFLRVVEWLVVSHMYAQCSVVNTLC